MSSFTWKSRIILCCKPMQSLNELYLHFLVALSKRSEFFVRVGEQWKHTRLWQEQPALVWADSRASGAWVLLRIQCSLLVFQSQLGSPGK